MKKYMLILLLAAFLPVFGARAVCDGRVRENNPGWRYMDSDFFGRIQTEKCSDGSMAAALNPLMGKARFIFHIANITAEPEITKDMGLRIVFRYAGIKTPPPLRIQLSYDKPDWSPKGKLSDSVKADDYATGTEWRTAEVPLTAFPEAVGHKLKRVQVFPEHNIDMPPDGKLLIREISVVRDPKFAAAKIIAQETADSNTGAAAGNPATALFSRNLSGTPAKTVFMRMTSTAICMNRASMSSARRAWGPRRRRHCCPNVSKCSGEPVKRRPRIPACGFIPK